MTKPVEELYLNRNIVVAATNLAEASEEILELKDATYKSFLDSPKQAINMFKKIFDKLRNSQGEEISIEFMRKTGLFTAGSVVSGLASYAGTLTKNNPLALTGRFFQNYLSDFDKFVSNNADRNYSGFAFILESLFDPLIRATKGKIPQSLTKILLAAQYAINWSGVTLANRSQGAEHDENLVKIHHNPLKYMKEATTRLIKALNPYNVLQQANLLPANS